jgi:hypothetical protein
LCIVLIILCRYIDDHGWMDACCSLAASSGGVYLQLQVGRMSCESGTVVRLMCLACGFRGCLVRG